MFTLWIPLSQRQAWASFALISKITPVRTSLNRMRAVSAAFVLRPCPQKQALRRAPNELAVHWAVKGRATSHLRWCTPPLHSFPLKHISQTCSNGRKHTRIFKDGSITIGPQAGCRQQNLSEIINVFQNPGNAIASTAERQLEARSCGIRLGQYPCEGGFLDLESLKPAWAT